MAKKKKKSREVQCFFSRPNHHEDQGDPRGSKPAIVDIWIGRGRVLVNTDSLTLMKVVSCEHNKPSTKTANKTHKKKPPRKSTFYHTIQLQQKLRINTVCFLSQLYACHLSSSLINLNSTSHIYKEAL